MKIAPRWFVLSAFNFFALGCGGTVASSHHAASPTKEVNPQQSEKKDDSFDDIVSKFRGEFCKQGSGTEETRSRCKFFEHMQDGKPLHLAPGQYMSLAIPDMLIGPKRKDQSIFLLLEVREDGDMLSQLLSIRSETQQEEEETRQYIASLEKGQVLMETETHKFLLQSRSVAQANLLPLECNETECLLETGSPRYWIVFRQVENQILVFNMYAGDRHTTRMAIAVFHLIIPEKTDH